jgi:xanthine dehydrogenase molybdopterin-binding subunit B
VLLHLLLQEGALLQASGEALYTGDEPLAPNALHAAYVTSARAAGSILHVDWQPALAVDGERGEGLAGWVDR